MGDSGDGLRAVLGPAMASRRAFRSDGNSPNGRAATLAGLASPTTAGMARPRPVRRPSPGEEFLTHGPANAWAGAQQIPGGNTGVMATRRRVVPRRRFATPRAAVRRRVTISGCA